MSIVIATGWAESGWDAVFPALRRVGPEPVDGRYCAWLGEVFPAADALAPTPVARPMQPDASLAARLPGLLPEADAPQLLADSRNLWLLDFLAARLPGAKFLLFFTRPETALALALRNGHEPQRVLAEWRAANAHLARFWRRHRARTCLLDAEAVAGHPESFFAAIRRFGIPVASQEAASDLASGLSLPLMERLLAAYLVRAETATRALHDELEAGALPLGNGAHGSAPDPAGLFDEFRQWQQRQNDLPRQLEAALAGLGAAAENERQLDARIAGLQQDIEAERTARASLEAVRKDAAEEKELLFGQLHCVQEALESSQGRIGQIEAERQELHAQQQQLHAQLAQAQQAVRAQEAAKKEVEEDNELLLLQLDQLQKELEHYVLAYQQANADLRARTLELGQARFRLTSMLGSVSWKATLPLRFLIDFFDLASRRRQRAITQQASLLEGSGLFNREWYLAVYEDVRCADVDPVRHYLMHGVAEGRNPSPVFDTQFYLAKYPDVAQSGMNPLVHFVRFGRNEGRQPTP